MKNNIAEAFIKGADIDILMKEFNKSKEDVIQAIIEDEKAVDYLLEQSLNALTK